MKALSGPSPAMAPAVVRSTPQRIEDAWALPGHLQGQPGPGRPGPPQVLAMNDCRNIRRPSATSYATIRSCRAIATMIRTRSRPPSRRARG
jgi:hypothetical protein